MILYNLAFYGIIGKLEGMTFSYFINLSYEKGYDMHTLKLEIEDTVFDKVMMFLQNLPKNEVRIKEDIVDSKNEDFIEYLASNPIVLPNNERFMSRVEANVR